MPDLSTILLFCGVSFLMVATPGPGLLYIVGRSVDQGRRAGIASMLGIEAAEMVHLLAVAVGLSALLATSVTALDVLRYLGAAYLIWLGVRRWREAARDAEIEVAAASDRRLFGEGFVVQLLNPKPAVFFIALFPQFLDGDAPVLPQTLVLGTLYLAIAMCSDLVYVALSARVAERFKRSARARRLTARASALMYIGLGALAALSGSRVASASR